ncbi:MAG TPA: AraC family transcriptional regulator [Lachnospiraceae bacterium]|nr:AraC family transcriptional regulator [Lachnospiraceae bacterium]
MQKSGYLYQNFRLFHLRDKRDRKFDYHYHDFNKIIIFLSGNVTYYIEGKAYVLKPWDILLVNNHAIHKPVISPDVYYERIVIWIDEDFMKNTTTDITACFQKASERSFNLIRLGSGLIDRLKNTVRDLELSLSENENEFGHTLLTDSLFMELMVYINRIYLGKKYESEPDALKYDKRIEEILKYIHLHLSEEISIDLLADSFYMNKYHLMHKFKEETGYTVHSYILQKRLLYVSRLHSTGTPITKAALAGGFKDYSTYYRAVKRENCSRHADS